MQQWGHQPHDCVLPTRKWSYKPRLAVKWVFRILTHRLTLKRKRKKLTVWVWIKSKDQHWTKLNYLFTYNNYTATLKKSEILLHIYKVRFYQREKRSNIYLISLYDRHILCMYYLKYHPHFTHENTVIEKHFHKTIIKNSSALTGGLHPKLLSLTCSWTCWASKRVSVRTLLSMPIFNCVILDKLFNL